MNQYAKIITILGMLAGLGAGSFLFSQYQEIRRQAIEKEKSKIAAYIQDRASAILLPEDFTIQDAAHQHIVFEGFFDTIQSPALVRLKVWNKDAVILWSNLDAIIGSQFLDNQGVKRGLKGEVGFKIMAAQAGQFSERDYAELSETFIPVFDAGGQVVGVIDVYTSTVQLHETINQEFQQRTLITGAIVLLGFAFISWALKYFFKASGKSS